MSYKSNFVSQIMHYPILSKEQEKQLLIMWQKNKDESALHSLISPYIRLVFSIAVPYKHYGIPFADLVQEGVLGLIEAANKFDFSHDVRFATYARWWIKAYLQNYVLRNWSIVRTGLRANNKNIFFSLKYSTQQMQELDLDETVKEELLSNVLSISQKDLSYLKQRLNNDDVSINNEFLLKDTSPSPEDIAIAQHDRAIFWQCVLLALECLTYRERIIIVRRLLSDENTTLEVIGQELGLSKERVRQLEKLAIKKIRASFKKYGLTSELLLAF